MALLMRVGYFCSGGHTELGARMLATGEREIAAIDAFLRKIDSEHIIFERLFPAREKPGPKHKPGQPPASLKDQAAGGVTGYGLIDIMEQRLKKYYRGNQCRYDAIVVVDDADCRFLEESAYLQWEQDLQEKVRTWTENANLVFIPLLASPEIEAWLLADWEEGFGCEYASIQKELWETLAKEEWLGSAPWIELENFGGPYDSSRRCCTRKLSDEINKVLGQIAEVAGIEVDRKTYTYSKRENGPDMLRRVRPDEVARLCQRFLGRALVVLQEMTRLQAPSK